MNAGLMSFHHFRFHTDGIIEYLREKRISYVVICPLVEKLEDNDQKYIDALKGRKTPFEKMIESETGTLREIYSK